MSRFTPISEIGEFQLINEITKEIKINQPSTKLSVGDDAAVVFHGNKQLLLTTDTLTEGVHFNLMYTPLKHLGYKSIVVSVSDICAMNGTPTQALVSLAIPNKYSVEMIKDLYSGLHLACNNYNIDLIGGDTTASPNSLVLTITILGVGSKKEIIYRKGACSGDLLAVSGSLGGAYLGLQILEREKIIFEQNNNTQPLLEKYAELLERQLKPEARIDVVKQLRELNIRPTSMIDISDGLSSEVGHLSNASGVGLRLFEEKIPISKDSRVTAEELHLDPVFCALHGGEDYELLFTISPKDYKKLSTMADVEIIGHVTGTKESGVQLLNRNNEIIDLQKESWDSFIRKRNRNI